MHTKYLFTDVPLETLLSWRESAAPIKKTPIHLSMVHSCAMTLCPNLETKGSSHQPLPILLLLWKPRTSRKRWASVFLVVFVLSLTACGAALGEPTSQFNGSLPATITPAPLPTLTPAPTAGPSQRVSIWLDWKPHELQSLYQAIEEFQTDHSDVEFAITYRPRSDLLSAFENAASTGRGPSILLGPSQWGPLLREKGYILNLSPLLDPGMESDVHAIAWTQAAEGSQLFGLPLELQGIVLYRNRTLAAQPVAELGEWFTIAEKLHSTNLLALNADLGLEVALPMMAACGVELFDARGDLLVFEQGGICWLELLSQIADLGRVVFDSEDDLELFKIGQAAWLIGSTELRAELTEAIGVTNLKVDPWPLYDATGFPLRGFTWSENAYLVAGSTESDLEASWTFLQFLFGHQGQQILSDPAGAAHIPSTSALDPPDSLMLEASSMLRAGVPLPLRDELTLAQEPLMAAIQSAVLQGSDPAFALKMAEERLDLLRSSSQTP